MDLNNLVVHLNGVVTAVLHLDAFLIAITLGCCRNWTPDHYSGFVVIVIYFGL